MLPVRTILHPTDFSKHADCALQIAGELARAHDARLIVLHVPQGTEPPAWLNDRMAGSFPWTVDGQDALQRRIAWLRSIPGSRAESRVAEGLPAEEILRAANDDQCDLIVMGTQGRTGLDRVLAGSVAEEVMQKARGPVLTVKNPLPPAAHEPSMGQREPAAAASAS
jgi:nucleotide-binding universal stress UspA family protein